MSAPRHIAIQEAIVAAFNASVALQAAGLTPLREEAPVDGQTYPYSILVPISDSQSGRDSHGCYWTHAIQISVFGRSKSEVGTYLQTIQDTFEAAPIEELDNVDDGKVLQMLLLTHSILKESPRVYLGYLEYQIEKVHARTTTNS